MEEYHINISKHKELAIEHFKLIVKTFEDYDIEYWIEYGTMLGAVREKGFIPWDSEFDVGLWYNEYILHKDDLLRKFKKLGFFIDTTSKDRIKLQHKDLLIGSYSIDLHTYHVKNEVAFVSYNRNKETTGLRYYKFMKFFDKRIPKSIPISSMIKTIIKNKSKIPEEFKFIKTSYSSKYLYKIKTDDYILTEDNKNYHFIKSRLKRLLYWGVDIIVSSLPKQSFYSYIDSLERKYSLANKDYYKVQAIPIHFYKELSEIDFESTKLMGPRDGIAYVESIYGKDWHIGKSEWASTQNNINKDINTI